MEQAEQDARLVVTRQPATSPYFVQLNTFAPPFDDKKAREAIYHATNVETIGHALFNGWYPVSQMFTGPGGLFQRAEIPNYCQYDLERARALVSEVGGISITLGTVRNAVAERVVTALQTQWREAGIDVAVETYDLAALVQKPEVPPCTVAEQVRYSAI